MTDEKVLDSGDILRRTVVVVFKHLPQLTFITVVVYLPLLLLRFWSLADATAPSAATSPELQNLRAGCLELLLLLLSVVVTQAQAGAFALGIFESLCGRPFRTMASLGVAGRRLFPLVVAAILVGLCVAGGFLLFILPGLIVGLGLVVVTPVVIVERLGPLAALRRSWNLTAGNKFRIFFPISLWGALSLLGQFLVERGGRYGVLAELLVIFISFFSATTITLIYHDLRGIKDGLGAEDLVAVFE